jgi:quinoprotein glucose dehydrogenase
MQSIDTYDSSRPRCQRPGTSLNTVANSMSTRRELLTQSAAGMLAAASVPMAQATEKIRKKSQPGSVGRPMREGVHLPEFLAPILLSLCIAGCSAGQSEHSYDYTEYGAGNDWAFYDGNPAGTHYSELKDINQSNVGRLKVAWTYDTGESGANESNPLIVGGRLFFLSSKGRLICLDGGTGRERWTFDPLSGESARPPLWLRGVSYWTDGKERRILVWIKRNLYAVDADTGRPAANFGSSGHVELSTYGPRSTTPGAVYRDLIVIGGSGSTIRAFDVRTGNLRWTFHTIPQPGERGYNTWPKDAWKEQRGANDWAGMTLDEKRGLLFVPLGEAFDAFYGADRYGDNLFGSSLIALDASTGRLLWYFQTARHDLWDRDLPAPPALVSVVRNGKRVDAVAQITKAGFVYVLDRLTGKSLFPLVEKTTFPSDIPGEIAASTQIEPQLPAPFARQHVTADLLTHRTPEVAAAVAAQFTTLRSRGPWDPPSEHGTIVFPGFETSVWGGAAFDPETALLYVNANEMPWVMKLKKQTSNKGKSGGELYRDNCAGCHGKNRQGRPPDFPSLIDVSNRLAEWDIFTRIQTGGGRMPAFSSLDVDQIESLITYLQTGSDPPPTDNTTKDTPSTTPEPAYSLGTISEFLDPDGYPAVSPPWGTLNAINLNTGRYAWKIPFGEYPELAATGLKNTGSENYGGSIVTAGGLLFIGATSYDKKFHAYDKRTGKLLWETVLPAPGNATPATYRVNSRQFVVIAAGGGRPPKAPRGSTLIAFALPQ